MKTPAFIDQSNERQLPDDYTGRLLLWDIDKTYLNTRFSSFWGLAAIPFEWAVDKEAIPGVVPLIRALRHGPEASSAIVPLYFISGSPPQLRRVIERKMTLDGVDFDGITFKDQWGLVRAGRPKDIQNQVGYKLKALLAYRRQLPIGARWLMFGDDVEADADIFLLFGEVCAGLRDSALEARLRQLQVHSTDQADILKLCEGLEVGPDPVELVCIRQVRHRPLDGQDARILPCPDYLTTALVVADRGLVRPEAVTSVARALRRRGLSEADLSASADFARERYDVSERVLAYHVAARV